MGLRPTQGDEKRLGPAAAIYETLALSFVIPSAAERLQFSGSFVETWHLVPPQVCHLDRSAAQWRDLRFSLSETTLPYPARSLILSDLPR